LQVFNSLANDVESCKAIQLSPIKAHCKSEMQQTNAESHNATCFALPVPEK
jgi:hypothetical protein